MGLYSIGFNGHARKCDCTKCADSRAARVHDVFDQPTLNYPDIPKAGATVFVRSHFRKQPGHLKRFPNTRRALAEALAMLRRAT